MKCLKKTVRHYWKYSYAAWTQPILSANGTMGGDSFACSASSEIQTARQAWRAFDGDTSGAQDNWHSNSGHPQYIQWYNPTTLRTTNIRVQNRNSQGSFIKDYYVSYSDDNNTWTQLVSGTSPDQSAFAYWDIAISETTPHKYWRLTCTSSSGGNSGYTAIQTITITATKQVVIAGTSSDYDFYTDDETALLPTTTVRHYWKYQYEDYTSPVLSSKSIAETGVAGFKMLTGSNFYGITGNSTITVNTGTLITFDIGEHTQGIKSMGYIGVVSPNNWPGMVMSNIECSEDNENWTTISSSFGGRGDYLTNPLQITYPNNYRYIRFTSTEDDYGYGRGGAYGLKVAYSRGVVVAGTASDYDFYTDDAVYFGINQ